MAEAGGMPDAKPKIKSGTRVGPQGQGLAMYQNGTSSEFARYG